MEAMIYFLVNSGTLILLLALTFFLLGLWLGWLSWGKYREKWQLGEQALSGLRARSNSMLQENTRQQQLIERLQGNTEQLQNEEHEQQNLILELETSRSNLQQQQALEREQLSRDLDKAKSELLIEKGNNATLNADLSATAARAESVENQLASMMRERDSLRDRLRDLDAADIVLAKPAVAVAAAEIMPVSQPDKPELVHSALFGRRQDDLLGLLYTSRPEETDDLSQIKGIGNVLHQKLNAQGVYTFRQISRWSESNVQAFGQLFKFRDRIQHDDWIGQAKRLQEEKYGQEI